MSVAQGDVCRFDVIGDIDGTDEIVQTYQARLTTGTTISAAQAVQDWKLIWQDLWEIIEAIHNLLVVFRRVRGYNVTTQQLLGESAYGTPQAGTATGDSLPNQCTMPVTMKTIYPRVMLRKLWGPSSEDKTTADGLYGTAAIAIALAGAAFLFDPLIGLVGEWEYGYQSPVALEFVVPTVAIATIVPGTLRRRRVGVGS